MHASARLLGLAPPCCKTSRPRASPVLQWQQRHHRQRAMARRVAGTCGSPAAAAATARRRLPRMAPTCRPTTMGQGGSKPEDVAALAKTPDASYKPPLGPPNPCVCWRAAAGVAAARWPAARQALHPACLSTYSPCNTTLQGEPGGVHGHCAGAVRRRHQAGPHRDRVRRPAGSSGRCSRSRGCSVLRSALLCGSRAAVDPGGGTPTNSLGVRTPGSADASLHQPTWATRPPTHPPHRHPLPRRLKADTCPKTAQNFLELAQAGAPKGYKGSRFHRVIPQFMCQGGDFTNDNGAGHGGCGGADGAGGAAGRGAQRCRAAAAGASQGGPRGTRHWPLALPCKLQHPPSLMRPTTSCHSRRHRRLLHLRPHLPG